MDVRQLNENNRCRQADGDTVGSSATESTQSGSPAAEPFSLGVSSQHREYAFASVQFMKSSVGVERTNPKFYFHIYSFYVDFRCHDCGSKELTAPDPEGPMRPLSADDFLFLLVTP